MTLILSVLARTGIAMAGDSTITITRNGEKVCVPNAVAKVKPIPDLHAIIGCWGLGQIGTDDQWTVDWLDQFIADNRAIDTLDSFAKALAQAANKKIEPTHKLNDPTKNQIGFQLAGYVNVGGTKKPTFYHIHNGCSEVLEGRDEAVDHYQVNANHDWPPDRLEAELEQNRTRYNRTGDYAIHALRCSPCAGRASGGFKMDRRGLGWLSRREPVGRPE